jgi:colanic acid biosynthesis protein WcaH
LGLYEHFYDDSIFTDDHTVVSFQVVSTHYVVNGFEVVLPESHVNLPCEQHNEYRWLSEEEFKTSDEVHVHSRWYVDPELGFLL